jgi:hypothetical protein
MKHIVNLIFNTFVIITCGTDVLSAQSPNFSIFDSFDRPVRAGEGKVIVHQSNALKQLVGTRIDSENIDISNGKTFLVTKGFRVQAYSGNSQRVSKDEVLSMQKKMKELYPNLDSYEKYDAPFWKLRVGNFRFYEEASSMLRELKAAFPDHKNEMSIIEDEIRLQLDQ